jgi:hypothetical protein
MTQQERQKAKASWSYHRSTFHRRSYLFPNLAVFVPVIDRVCELGYSEKLYADTSLDNLVISVRPNPRDRRQTILVIPKENMVEFRLYPKDGEAEVSKVAPEQAASALDHLLPRLIASLETSTSGTVNGDSEA